MKARPSSLHLSDVTARYTLDEFIELTFLPSRCKSAATAYQYKAVGTWLRRVLRREPGVADLNMTALDLFVASLPKMGVSTSRAVLLRKRFVTIWRFAAERGLTDPCALKAGQRNRALPLPIGEPGTVLAFFHDRYLPEILAPMRRANLASYWCIFRSLREWLGGDLRLDSLSEQRLAQWLMFLKAKGLKPITVHTMRGRLLAVWRFAADCGVAKPVPRLRKIPIEREPPEAWSLEQFGRILEAAARIQKPPIGGVPADLFWPALLRCAYWTALRRGALLRLRPEDVDLEGGWIHAVARNAKNGRGLRCRIGTDAIAALRAIWDGQRDRVFPVGDNVMNWKFLDNHFLSILRIAAVPRGRAPMGLFHQIRRTAVTFAAAYGGDAAAIALAGHSGKAVNERYLDVRFLPGRDATQWLPPLSAGSPNAAAESNSAAASMKGGRSTIEFRQDRPAKGGDE